MHPASLPCARALFPTGTLVCLLAALTPFTILAAEAEPGAGSALRRWAEQDYMLGTWGGTRSAWSERGFDFEFFYAGSLPANWEGGLRPGRAWQGGLLLTLDVDSAKLAGYEGGTFHAGALGLHGEKPFSDRYIGDLNKVNLLDYPNAMRLWELWYRQGLLDGRLAFKAGALSVDRDFVVPEFCGSLGQSALINQTFFFPTMAFNLYDIPGLPPQHHGLPATPASAPGFLVQANPGRSIQVRAAVYGGNPDRSFSGTTFPLSQNGGALAYFEVGYRLNQDPHSSGLEGSYKLGGYYHSGDFVDVENGVMSAFLEQAGLPFPAPGIRSGNHGLYLLAEQQLWRERARSDPARQGLTGFLRLGLAPSDRNLAHLGLDGGLIYAGLLPGRDWDTLAVAVSYLEISDRIRRAQRDILALVPGALLVADHEAVTEISYRFQATAWWTVQPSFQYVTHPGGSGAIRDAKVFIVQTTLRF